MNLSEKIRETHPHNFFLDSDNMQTLRDYLLHKKWIEANRNIQSVEKAGEGNMNKVLRVLLTGNISFIIKQSRPWVEKFPDIPAPADRANIEGLYFKKTSRNKVIASFSPELLHADPDSHILMIEDLGKGSDLSYIYQRENNINEETLVSLINYLTALHQNFTQTQCDFHIENRGMRNLNAEHLFRFPFIEDNGLNLDEITPGLAQLGVKYRSDSKLLSHVDFLKYRYLQSGDTLLHGDFYPGSFLRTDEGIKVIDPEFCFFGDAEFDLGVFYAHMLMAQQSDKMIKNILEYYEKPPQFSDMLYRHYAGIEIMRRLLGLAQLPLPLNLNEKEVLLEKAYSMMMQE